MGWLDKFEKAQDGAEQNRIAHAKSSKQARIETAKENVKKNYDEVNDTFLWNLPGSISPLAVEDLLLGGLSKGAKLLKGTKLGKQAINKMSDVNMPQWMQLQERAARTQAVKDAEKMVREDLADPETIKRAVALGLDPDKLKMASKNLNYHPSESSPSSLSGLDMTVNANQINAPYLGTLSANDIAAHETGHLFHNQDFWNRNYPYSLPNMQANLFQTAKDRDPISFEMMKKHYKGYSTRKSAPTEVDEMLGKLTPRQNLSEVGKRSFNYFDKASNQYGTNVDNMVERLPMFREYRQGMRDAGILKNKWDEITPAHMQAFYKHSPNNRLNSFMDNTRGNIDLIKKVSKIAPAIGTGTVLANQQDGGWLDKFQNRGVVKDNQGYWNLDNHGKVVEIDSNNITMQGVDQPLLGISDTGDIQYMEPGKDYKFKGKKVTEYPMAQEGDEEQLEQLEQVDVKGLSNSAKMKAYRDSLSLFNFSNKLGKDAHLINVREGQKQTRKFFEKNPEKLYESLYYDDLSVPEKSVPKEVALKRILDYEKKRDNLNYDSGEGFNLKYGKNKFKDSFDYPNTGHFFVPMNTGFNENQYLHYLDNYQKYIQGNIEEAVKNKKDWVAVSGMAGTSLADAKNTIENINILKDKISASSINPVGSTSALESLAYPIYKRPTPPKQSPIFGNKEGYDFNEEQQELVKTYPKPVDIDGYDVSQEHQGWTRRSRHMPGEELIPLKEDYDKMKKHLGDKAPKLKFKANVKQDGGWLDKY